MKFRTKLILGFSIVIFFISAILGIVCYNYNSKRLSEKAAQSLKFYSRQTAANVDSRFHEACDRLYPVRTGYAQCNENIAEIL